MKWIEISGNAMYDNANWDLEVCRKSGMTAETAAAIATADDRITFFFFMRTNMSLPIHGNFSPGDAVFFSGTPWLSGAPMADTYEKPSPHGRIVGTSTPQGNGWISLKASMQVPYVTSPQGTVFIWPGLQPGGNNFFPIGNGVLQPVLTYGPSCAPNPTNLPETGWWISGQYVNTDSDPNAKKGPYKGCFGGPQMAVNAGNILTCLISYDASTKTWNQLITNESTGDSVSFPISLTVNGQNPQEQNIAYFCLENPGHSSLTQSVSLYNIEAKVMNPQSNLGQDLLNSPCVEGISLSADQKTLSISRIVIYNPIFNGLGGRGNKP